MLCCWCICLTSTTFQSLSLMQSNFSNMVPPLMWSEFPINGNRQQYQQQWHFDALHQPGWGREEDNHTFVTPEASLISCNSSANSGTLKCYCSFNICLPASKTFGIMLSISHFEANLSIAWRISILRAIFWFGWEIYMRCNLFNLLLEKQYEIIRLTSNDQKRRLNSFCYCCTASLHTGHVKTELWRRN